MMERHPTLALMNENKYLLNIRLHLNNDSLKASTKRISSSNGRFGGVRNNTTDDRERRYGRRPRTCKSSSTNSVPPTKN